MKDLWDVMALAPIDVVTTITTQCVWMNVLVFFHLMRTIIVFALGSLIFLSVQVHLTAYTLICEILTVYMQDII